VRITILGSGSPHPNPLRSAPAVLVEEAGGLYLFDCGEGATRQVQLAGSALPEVTTVFFTHLHADHALGYGALLIGGWVAGRRSLRVFGPPGLTRLHEAHVADLYRDDIRYRMDLGRPPAGIIDAVEVRELAQPGIVYQDDRVVVSWIPVPHSIAAVSYRIDARSGGSAVISGDTAYHEPLAAFARDAAVLVHDAVLSPNGTYREGFQAGDVSWGTLARYHTTAQEAARIAALAGARTLILTHFLPHTDTAAAIALCAPLYRGRVLAAEDLMVVVADAAGGQP